jgi:hypothetical protein
MAVSKEDVRDPRPDEQDREEQATPLGAISFRDAIPAGSTSSASRARYTAMLTHGPQYNARLLMAVLSV